MKGTTLVYALITHPMVGIKITLNSQDSVTPRVPQESSEVDYALEGGGFIPDKSNCFSGQKANAGPGHPARPFAGPDISDRPSLIDEPARSRENPLKGGKRRRGNPLPAVAGDHSQVIPAASKKPRSSSIECPSPGSTEEPVAPYDQQGIMVSALTADASAASAVPSDDVFVPPKLVWEALPLSPELERLRRVLAALGEVLKFLSSQQATPTWWALLGVLSHFKGQIGGAGGGGSGGGGKEGSKAVDHKQNGSRTGSGISTSDPLVGSTVTLEDLYLISRFVPSVLVLKSRSQPHDNDSLDFLDRRFMAGHVGGGRIQGGHCFGGRHDMGPGSGSVEADALREGWSSHLMDQVASSMATRGGQLISNHPNSYVDQEESSVVVSMLDPGRSVSCPLRLDFGHSCLRQAFFQIYLI